MVSRGVQAGPSTVVIDNGTGYTKMGYAGNLEPSYLIPSCIAKAVQKVSQLAKFLDSLYSRALGSNGVAIANDRRLC